MIAPAQFAEREADLRLVTEDQARRLGINRRRRNWRIREPLDDTLPVETPRLLLRSFSALLSDSVQSKFEILSRLALPSKDIEGLACLPEGFLEEKSAPISLRYFTSGRKSATEPDRLSTSFVSDFSDAHFLSPVAANT